MMDATRPTPADPATSEFERTPRERAQMVQRLQVGLFGLSLMLLLVGLANIIMDNAGATTPPWPARRPAPARARPAILLADIGVIPSPDAGKPDAGASPHVPPTAPR
jgi:hypothetical protein